MREKIFLKRLFTTLSSFLFIFVIGPPAFACETEVKSPPSTTSTVTSYSDIIELSEIYPIPSSEEEEFIELYNAGSDDVDVAGWKIGDASGKIYTINSEHFSSTTLEAETYFVIPHSISKIFLNNTGDSVFLYQPDDALLFETVYEKASAGKSWSYIEEEWQWTEEITKGEENTLPIEESADTASSSSTSHSTSTPASHVSEEPAEEEISEESAELETSTEVFINELLPNPEGSDNTDEWIEIVNRSDKEISLHGWQLTDESKYYEIGDITLDADEFAVFEVPDTKISLNNTADKVFLIDPFGKVLQGTEYTKAPNGQSWSRDDDGSWQWTTPTPGEENEFAEATGGETIEEVASVTDEEKVTNNSASSEDSKKSESTASGVISIAEFRTVENETTAIIEGTVSVLPDIFGSQYFYIQDGTAGIQVYSSKKTFPELAVGDHIRVVGAKSESRGETRIKISAIEDITVIEHGGSIQPVETAELNESLEGMLVQVSGTVMESSSTKAVLDESLHIALKKGAGISKDLLKEGSSVTVAGIVIQSTDEYRLQPRSNEDIRSDAAGGEGSTDGLLTASAHSTDASGSGITSNSPLSTDLSHSSSSRTRDIAIVIGVLLGSLLVIGGYKYWEWKKTQQKDAAETTSDENTAEKPENVASTSSIFDFMRSHLQQKE